VGLTVAASFVKSNLRASVVITAVLIVITGFVYPGIVTVIAQTVFPHQANGSLVRRDGGTIGSALIGQTFTAPEYFHGRPSAAGKGYDATASSGTNKGPTDRNLADTLIAGAVAQAVTQDGAVRGAIPADYVTSSASGLDPHISPAAALLQVDRVARTRSADPARVRQLVNAHVEGRQFGLLGEPRVNVLLLNLALDSIAPFAHSK
jgi:K+-transporting ATPase ATPase C chain